MTNHEPSLAQHTINELLRLQRELHTAKVSLQVLEPRLHVAFEDIRRLERKNKSLDTQVKAACRADTNWQVKHGELKEQLEAASTLAIEYRNKFFRADEEKAGLKKGLTAERKKRRKLEADS
jgi:chromosome segregation ATPase